MKKLSTRIACLALAATMALASCEGPEGDAGAKGDQGDKGDKGDKGDQGEDYPSAVELKTHSITQDVLIKKPGFESVETYPLISSEDLISGFTFGGSADGSGLLKLNNGYSLLVNHEDNFSVSRIFLDETFTPVSGEYILNSTGGQWRLCSATLATPEVHGFGPLYLTCGESSVESRTHALNPFAQGAQAGQSRELPAFGRWNAEQALPLPKTAFPGKTVIMIGDDDSGADGGQVAMYVSNTVGDLANGKLYVLRRKDLVTREKDMNEEDVVDVEFVEITGQTTMTGAEINAKSTELKSIAFNRVEDIDFRKDGVGRDVYFNVTGNSANTADRSKYGRTYHIKLSDTNPLEGTLELILDGDDRAGKAKDYQDVDNILVTKDYVYIQEDPNGYGDEAHDSYVYQYNIATKELKPVFELNHFRTDATLSAKFMSATSAKGSWEYGSFIDISDIIGVENTFLLCVQMHSWKLPAFRNPDGGTVRPDENQGSMIVVVKGLPR
ncbi:hypothetical protein [Dawidia cretensis]|uniref:hypothetical protein n=1 Tax=Dawidia cretensis TaxID=2782350 RepID=UPI0020B3AFC4|nr:hypothetical protein [Dawidia cretensis]